VYGNELQFQPSYFGERALAERAGITDIVAVVVYDGDEFAVQYKDGYPVITHTYYGGEKITHAYCLFTLPNGRRAGEVMTFAQIVKSWAKSKDPQQKIHKDQPEEMAKRTVTRRALKPYINSFVGDDETPESTNENEDVQVIQLEETQEEKPEGIPVEQPAAQPSQPSQPNIGKNTEIPF
jgi:recombinational DNA repair protein RecT